MPSSVSWAVLVMLSCFWETCRSLPTISRDGLLLLSHCKEAQKELELREVLKKALPVLPGQERDIFWGMEHPRETQPYGGGWEMLWAEPLPSHAPL